MSFTLCEAQFKAVGLNKVCSEGVDVGLALWVHIWKGSWREGWHSTDGGIHNL